MPNDEPRVSRRRFLASAPAAAIAVKTLEGPSPRLLNLIEQERAAFNNLPDGSDMDAFDAASKPRGDLFRQIVAHPAPRIADVRAKAEYYAEIMRGEGVDIDEEIRSGVNEDTFPLVVIRDLLALRV